jgi:hypothetical protein
MPPTPPPGALRQQTARPIPNSRGGQDQQTVKLRRKYSLNFVSECLKLVPVIIVEVLCVISGFPLRPDYPANLSSLDREPRAEVMYVPEMPGSERIMILLTQTRKYLYADCDHAFRAPDRRSVSRDNAVRDSFAAILR